MTARDRTQGNSAGLIESAIRVRVPCLARSVRDLPSEEQSFSVKLQMTRGEGTLLVGECKSGVWGTECTSPNQQEGMQDEG